MNSFTAGNDPRSQAAAGGFTWVAPQRVAEMLGVHPDSLKRLRRRGGGPAYSKFGRWIRYRLDVVVEWMEANTVISRAAEVAGGA